MKKIKIGIFIGALLSITIIPGVVYADTNTTKAVQQGASTSKVTTLSIEEERMSIKNNWLTQEVAKQLNKDVSELENEDFLNITKIDLNSVKIEGEFPKEICLLKNLQYLDLNYTRLEGEIPETLGELSNLTYLDLGYNKFTEIPDNIVEKIKNGKYSFCEVRDNKFKLDEGLYLLQGKWYYLDKSNNVVTGTKEIDGQTYHFNEDGSLKDGLQEENGQKYYYDSTGAVKNSWKQISGKWYFFNEDGTMVKNTMMTIDNKKYLFDANGARVTGLGYYNNNKYYFSANGDMLTGLIAMGNSTYYFMPGTGEMAINKAVNINGNEYRFDTAGAMIKNRWINNTEYIKPDGTVQHINSTFTHSNFNLNLFKYMTNSQNQASVDAAAIALHGGRTDNNCVYFASEAMRRVGLNIPTATANTYQLENILKGKGFASCSDLSYLKPGDIVFTNHYSHVYIFMGWAENGYAYIVDNQKYNFDNQIYHKRAVYVDTATTDRATHFYYYPGN